MIIIIKRAIQGEYVHFNLLNLRDYTKDKHKTTDDRPFGGGPGMILKPEPLFAAVESLKTNDSHIILLSPSGRLFNQSIANRLSNKESHLILICGHYEGIDERVRQELVHEEISIGEYILTNGGLASAVLSDAVVRLIPGVLGGGKESLINESFNKERMEHPQYTRPETFRNMTVPKILLSGDHGAILKWKKLKSEENTNIYNKNLKDKSFKKSKNNT